MENNEENVNPQDEQQTEEVEETTEKKEEEPAGPTDKEKEQEAEIGKLKRLLKKKDKAPVEETKEKDYNLSQKDIIFLAKANVHEDDLDEILDYAKYKGITAGEALKSNVMQSHIKERNEERKTAEVTQTKGGQRGSMKQTEEALWEKAQKGEEVDPQKLAEARMALKLKKLRDK